VLVLDMHSGPFLFPKKYWLGVRVEDILRIATLKSGHFAHSVTSGKVQLSWYDF